MRSFMYLFTTYVTTDKITAHMCWSISWCMYVNCKSVLMTLQEKIISWLSVWNSLHEKQVHIEILSPTFTKLQIVHMSVTEVTWILHPLIPRSDFIPTSPWPFLKKINKPNLQIHDKEKAKSLTWKNFSQSFSKGNEPGVKNMKAIFGVLVWTGGALRISFITTSDAISSSVNGLKLTSRGLLTALQPSEEKRKQAAELPAGYI